MRYQREVLQVDHSTSTNESIGKSLCEISERYNIGINVAEAAADDDMSDDDMLDEFSKISQNKKSIERAAIASNAQLESLGLPALSDESFNGGFGKPSRNHSFTQEGSFETIVFIFMKREVHLGSYLGEQDKTNLRATHPLIDHLYKMIEFYKISATNNPEKVDFSRLVMPDPNFTNQKEIPRERVRMFMSCLFQHNLDVAKVFRFAGDEYTGGYRNVKAAVERMRGLVDDDLIAGYVRLMISGSPSHFNAESTRDNFLLHWRQGNHKSVQDNSDIIQKSMNKLERNRYVIPFLSYIARFVPNLFLTPIHILQKADKDPRVIYDASRRFTALSRPINRMTSTHLGVELDCDYGKVLERLLIRIWNLRVTYPNQDIVIHANDVKSCFRQLKHHPDVAGAFSYIIEDMLYLSCGLTMGADFSPGSWEVLRRINEQLATNLFEDNTLVEKHRERLNRLKWSKKLGKGTAGDFVQAHRTAKHSGVLTQGGEPENTPHHMFVDDDLYADVYNIPRVEQTIAAGIESIFIMLGESAPDIRQDPISWDKLEEMIIHFLNKVLGQIINTRKMTVETPPEFVTKVVKLLETTWRGGSKPRKSFTVKEAENLAGVLAHISNTAPWLKHLMPQLYTSLASAIGTNTSWLICTNKHFRTQMKIAKEEALDEKGEMLKSFAQAEMARKVHNLDKVHFINKTLRAELDLIRQALSSNEISKATPIAHLIPDLIDAYAFGDSSLDAAGGWSIQMKFLWWIEWPDHIKSRTLRFVKDGSSGILIDINALEYATILINYAASIYYWVTENNRAKHNIHHPTVQIYADNKSAECWATKGCKRSLIGRRLGRLQCAMMIDNPVALATGHIDTKSNEIADRISRFKSETNTLIGLDTLMQEFPQLKNCRRFHPSQYLISLILDALSSEKPLDPLELKQRLLSNPGSLAL